MATTYKQEAWRLDDLFPGFEASETKQALAQFEERLKAFETNRFLLKTDIDQEVFVEILDALDQMTRLLSRLYDYAYLRFAADTQDQEATAYVARFRQLVAEAQNRTLFFELWWKELEDEAAERLLAGSGDYHYYLDSLRREKPYTLSEAEETIVNLKNVNGQAALLTLYSTITNRYIFRLELAGEVKELTREELSVYYRHADPAVRELAFRELLRVYEQDKSVLGQLYQYRARDWHSEFVSVRGHRSPMAVRNVANDIPDEVIDLLLDVCRENAPLFQRYFRLKAKLLGLDQLKRFDIYAPMTKSDKRYDFQEAIDLVLTSFRRFHPRVAELAERVFAEAHIDSEIRKGKQGGAFCATVTPELTPWLLQSYQGRADDIATLAHELGHAVHSMLANHHSSLTQHASLPLAETASTFGEMLLTDLLLAEDPDPVTRQDLLFRQMDTNYATITRQAFFAIFEREAHQQVMAGATIDQISEAYGKTLEEQFGDAVWFPPEFTLEWVTVPHIFRTPFYVYAYAFGQLLVLSLYQQYLAEGESFIPRYLDLLAAGGSDSPENLLTKAGINMYAREFWQGGFTTLEAILEQLEALESLPD